MADACDIFHSWWIIMLFLCNEPSCMSTYSMAVLVYFHTITLVILILYAFERSLFFYIVLLLCFIRIEYFFKLFFLGGTCLACKLTCAADMRWHSQQHKVLFFISDSWVGGCHADIMVLHRHELPWPGFSSSSKCWQRPDCTVNASLLLKCKLNERRSQTL